MTVSRENSRYPYTYACDWLRQAGIAESRSDASRWISNQADRIGTSHESFAMRIANQYVHFYSKLERMEAEKQSEFEHWRQLDTLYGDDT